VVEIVLRRMTVEEERQHLSRAGAEFHRLAGGHRGLLRDAPDFRVFEWILWIVLDLANDARPAPRRVNGIEHRADGIGKQRRARIRGLQFLVLKTLPALK